jgi:hypothetical protein
MNTAELQSAKQTIYSMMLYGIKQSSTQQGCLAAGHASMPSEGPWLLASKRMTWLFASH